MITLLLFKKKDCIACDIMSNMLTELAARYAGKNVSFVYHNIDTSDKYFENYFKFKGYPALVVCYDDVTVIKDFIRYGYCARIKPSKFTIFEGTIPVNNITDILDAYVVGN